MAVASRSVTWTPVVPDVNRSTRSFSSQYFHLSCTVSATVFLHMKEGETMAVKQRKTTKCSNRQLNLFDSLFRFLWSLIKGLIVQLLLGQHLCSLAQRF